MIEVNDVTKRYGDTVAVDHLSFSVKPGIVTGFLGPNGAGKTTTMRMILGLDSPTSGHVTVNGRPYRGIGAPMRQVGALLDAKAAHGGHTAAQHLRWLAQAGGIPTSRVPEVLELVGLSEVASRRVGGFSLGMYQRLGIAAALLGDPDILLFDEPVNGLDPEGIRWIRSLLQELAAEGRTIFLSSHLMSEMEATADHIIVIGRGRLIADATLAEFTQRSTSSHVRVVSPQAINLAPLLQRAGGTLANEEGALIVTGVEAASIGSLAAANGIELHELTPRRASLEAAFMELTQASQEYQASGATTTSIAETALATVGMEIRCMTSATITSTTRVPARTTAGAASFMNTLASEWSKLATLPATYITLGLGLFLSVGTTAVAAFAFGASNAEWPDEFDPILFSMVGNVFALIVYSVFGVLAVSREYTSGMIRLTLIATPNRSRVLLAKLLIVSTIILVLGFVTTIGMFYVGQGILGAYGLPSDSLANADARWVVLGLGATMPFFPILGLAIGVLLRSTAGGITAVLGLLWFPQIISEVLPMWARENIVSLMPGAALDSLTIGQMLESPEYSAAALGAVLVGGWLLAIVGAAFFVLRRRDA